MAINKTVNKSTKSHGAMRNCMEYVLREEKVRDGLCTVTGPFGVDVISYDTVYRAFLDEKRLWDKDSGRMYAHNIISFHKDEQITPEEALDFGICFAEKWFDGFQTLVAVHQDKDHIHIHLVTNTVSYIDGRKLHNTKADQQRMKDLTNQMCMDQGLTVAEKGHHFDGSLMDEYDITAWSKDKFNLIGKTPLKSYVADCAMTISGVLSSGCVSREQFISDMSEHGWSVRWTDNRKNITFEDTEGHKVRDTNLSKTFNISIGKEGLDAEFIRQSEIRRKYEHERQQERERDVEYEQLSSYYAQVESAIAGICSQESVRDNTTSGRRNAEEGRENREPAISSGSAYLREIRSAISDAGSREENSAAERKDREAERERSRVEAERRTAGQERMARNRKQTHKLRDLNPDLGL